MKKQLLFTTILLFVSFAIFAQEVWYDIDNAITNITLSSTASCTDCTITTVTNPDAGDTVNATNVTLWKVPASSTPVIENKVLKFDFPPGQGIAADDFSSLIITARFYFPEYDYFNNFDSVNRLRLYLGSTYVQVKLNEADEAGWYNLVFDFSAGTSGGTPSDVTSGEFRTIGQSERFTNLDNDLNYYFDTIISTVAYDSTLSSESPESKNNSLKLLSNPVKNTLEVSNKIKSATIYNSLGKALKSYNDNTTFDVSNLSAGLYIFHAKTYTGATQVLRFVKK
ncbi:T9SS type A sorting domain-containing protein [Algibacter miyuki]|uniref:T9SS type A sorting domain-containing protein n=1 Tax=Algibacter miyuki TaxID=1306933 RepID=A0ABV5H2X4_9FLAO|nr:T9SS type A sorting domain-containing protein [Algibacter miyuki]MDN3663918.1 T9SS type A sorting domain-containing protein [Algibacter miyuki]